MKLTFALDVQLNDKEDWIAQGTQFEVSDNPYHLNRFENATPVIVTEIISYQGVRMEIEPTVEWFDNQTFAEFRN